MIRIIDARNPWYMEPSNSFKDEKWFRISIEKLQEFLQKDMEESQREVTAFFKKLDTFFGAEDFASRPRTEFERDAILKELVEEVKSIKEALFPRKITVKLGVRPKLQLTVGRF